MGFHWGDGPSGINQVVAIGGSGSPPTTTSLKAAAKVEKKGSKAQIKSRPSKETATGSERIVAFELVFTNSITREQLTVRVPAAGAFHDRARLTTIQDVQRVGMRIAKALNAGFHEPGRTKKPPKK